ncbi:hypothetical protein HWV62_26440 [Athelia sp. TMB]|nr:hypothetical protein HWV62_26440 [Athelia sp. TMB]
MPEIFKDLRGRLVNVEGRQVTSELAILLTTAIALGAYRSDIDQEIFADTPDGPISTRTSVTIDFSTNWRTKDSPWIPPSGMPLEEAVDLLVRGFRPLDFSESPDASRSPSPSVDGSSSTASPGPRIATESPHCPPSSRSPSPVLRAAIESLVDQTDEILCDVCLAKLFITSPMDCDCVPVSVPIISNSIFTHYCYTKAGHYPRVFSGTMDVVTLTQRLETPGATLDLE